MSRLFVLQIKDDPIKKPGKGGKKGTRLSHRQLLILFNIAKMDNAIQEITLISQWEGEIIKQNKRFGVIAFDMRLQSLGRVPIFDLHENTIAGHQTLPPNFLDQNSSPLSSFTSHTCMCSAYHKAGYIVFEYHAILGSMHKITPLLSCLL